MRYNLKIYEDVFGLKYYLKQFEPNGSEYVGKEVNVDANFDERVNVNI